MRDSSASQTMITSIAIARNALWALCTAMWYALAWDRLRDDVRFFRLDRLQRIQPLAADFRLRRPDPFLTAGEPEARTM